MKLTSTSLLCVVFLAVLLAACGKTTPVASPTPQPAAPTPPPPSATPTADVQATVNAAVGLTATASAAAQATVNAAVKSTVVAMPTWTPQPTVQGNSMSEEELAALIEKSVNEAVNATNQANQQTTQATADGTITAAEAQTIYVAAANADQLIAYSEELIEAYLGLYAEYATATIQLLTAIEQDLSVMATNMEQIATIASKGAQSATAAIKELNAAAQSAGTKASQVKTSSQDYGKKVSKEVSDREKAAMEVKPDKVPTDLQSTIAALYTFTDALKSGFTDGKINPAELNKISQASANARAGLSKFGGAQLGGLSGGMEALTRQAARGQWPQAKAELPKFEKSLPARPGGLRP
ncbi:MAG TPA: hypothetical protein VIO61_06985 [Anaerolineaceae bacterium]